MDKGGMCCVVESGVPAAMGGNNNRFDASSRGPRTTTLAQASYLAHMSSQLMHEDDAVLYI